MLEKLAQASTNKLIVKNTVPEDKAPVYNYGFELLYSTLSVYLTIILLAVIFKVFYFSIIYILFFTPIRLYSGGYHASTYNKCYILSNLFFVFAVALTFIIPSALIPHYTYGMMLLSAIIIFIKAPVANKNHPLSKKKYLRNRKRARIIIIIETIIIFLWTQLNPVSEVALMAACTTTVVALLIIITPSERRTDHVGIIS